MQPNKEEKKTKRKEKEDNSALGLGLSPYTVQLPPGEIVSHSIKMRGGLRGAEGVQVSEGIIYERG